MPITTPLEWSGTRLNPTAPDSSLPDRSTNRIQEPIYLPDREHPLPGQSYYDPRATGLINSQAGEDAAKFDSRLNYGSEKSGIMSNSQDPMLRALEGNYDRQSNAEKNVARTENAYQSRMMASGNLNNAMQKQEDVYRNELDNWQQQMQYRAKREAVYNQWRAAKERGKLSLFNTVFNGVGSFIGGSVGG